MIQIRPYQIGDLEAIEENLLKGIRSDRFKNGIENLTRGKAATIIATGVLRRKGQSWIRK